MNKPFNNSFKYIFFNLLGTLLISGIVSIFAFIPSYAYNESRLVCTSDIEELPFYFSNIDSNPRLNAFYLASVGAVDILDNFYICLYSVNDTLNVLYITPDYYDEDIVCNSFRQPYSSGNVRFTSSNGSTYTENGITYYYWMYAITNGTYKNYYLDGGVLTNYTSLSDIVADINYNPFTFNSFSFVGGKSNTILSQYITRMGIIHSTYASDGRAIPTCYYETYLDDVLIDSGTYENIGRKSFTYTDFLQSYNITDDSYITIYIYPIDENNNRGIGKWVKFYVDMERESVSGTLTYYDNETISGNNGTDNFSYDVSATDTVETGTSDSETSENSTLTIIEYSDSETDEQILEMLSNLTDFLTATTSQDIDVSQYFYSSSLADPHNYNFTVQNGTDYIYDNSSISEELSTIDTVVNMSSDVFDENGNIFKYYFDIFPISLWSVFLCFPTIFIIVLILKIFVWR